MEVQEYDFIYWSQGIMLLDKIRVAMPADSEIAVKIVRKVASLKGVDPVDLPPLYDTVDPDALETILTENDAATFLIHFNYTGYRVWIESEQEISITIEPAPSTKSTRNTIR